MLFPQSETQTDVSSSRCFPQRSERTDPVPGLQTSRYFCFIPKNQNRRETRVPAGTELWIDSHLPVGGQTWEAEPDVRL